MPVRLHRPWGRTLALLVGVALLALGPASCGDEEGSSSTANEAKPQAQTGSGAGEGESSQGAAKANGEKVAPSGSRDEAPVDFKLPSHEDSGDGSRQFRVPGGDNSVQEFGAEVSGSEFDKAAAAVHAFFDARAQRAFAVACTYLANSVAESLEELSEGAAGKDPSCASGLQKLTNPGTPKLLREEAAKTDVGALRIEGRRGFVLYRVGGARYAIPVTLEGDDFKVAALVGYPLD